MKCSYYECNKKLTLVDSNILCKCNNSYCTKHRLPEQHKCSYDYKTHFKKSIDIDKLKCVKKKITI